MEGCVYQMLYFYSPLSRGPQTLKLFFKYFVIIILKGQFMVSDSLLHLALCCVCVEGGGGGGQG